MSNFDRTTLDKLCNALDTHFFVNHPSNSNVFVKSIWEDKNSVECRNFLQSLADAVNKLNAMETKQTMAIGQSSTITLPSYSQTTPTLQQNVPTKLLLTDIFQPLSDDKRKLTSVLKTNFPSCFTPALLREVGMDALLKSGNPVLAAFEPQPYINNGKIEFVEFFQFLQDNNYTFEKLANYLSKSQPTLAHYISFHILPHC